MKRELTRDEIRTLLYLETRLVDYRGRVDVLRLNGADLEWLKQMAKTGFLRFGRIAFPDINGDGTHWVTFSEEAWAKASAARRQRADRGQAARGYEEAPS